MQSAAVDAAVLHLLARHHYRLNAPAGRARLRQSGQPREVRNFARAMLRSARRSAGPYRVATEQLGTAVRGGSAEVEVRVTSRRNRRPLSGVPVKIMGDAGVVSAGATDSTGRVLAQVPTPRAGERPVAVAVKRTPESRLLLRWPARAAGSRVVLGGVKRTLRSRATLLVQATPTVRVSAAKSKIVEGQRTAGRYVLKGGSGSEGRRTVLRLHGPFNTGVGTSCERRGNKSTAVTLTDNGTYPLPRWNVSRKGYYLWSVKVAGNPTNQPAHACGGKFHVVAP